MKEPDLSKAAPQPKDWERIPLEYDRQRLWTYRYINTALVDSYLAQLGGIPKKRKGKAEIGLTHGLPSAKFLREESDEALSYEQKIPILIDRLEEAELVTGARPLRSPDMHPDAPPLAFETFDATQVVFPASFFEGVHGVGQLKIWLGYPDPETFVDQPFNWSGSYLFLTEIQLDSGEFHFAMSGCSALRLLDNALKNNPALHTGNEDLLGRFDNRPIKEKLHQMGALFLEQRTITSLYKVRYITNEQYYPEAPQEGRVHDIVGYPLFIAE